MKCLECYADIPDSATSCPRCGTPTRATSSFSYLPAGAPPWPTAVPAGITTTEKQTAETVAPSTAKRVTSEKPRRSGGSIVTSFLLLILSIVVGVGATLGILAATGSLAFPGTSTAPRQVANLPTPIPTSVATPVTGTPSAATPTTGTQTNQLPTPSSFVAVKVAEVGISLKYPADWIQEKPQTTANFSAVELHPQQQLGIDFVVQRFSSTLSAQAKSVDEVNQTILQPTPNDTNIHNFKVVQPGNVTPSIAGVQWTELDATFTNSQGLLFHEVSISVKHNNLYYNINYLAPDIVYNQAMQKYYSQMLSSFQFLS